MDEAENNQNPTNPSLNIADVSGSISLNVALGIKKYHKEFNVEILEYKGLSEAHVWVKVKGNMKDIVDLNEKATHYKPSETRGI